MGEVQNANSSTFVSKSSEENKSLFLLPHIWSSSVQCPCERIKNKDE